MKTKNVRCPLCGHLAAVNVPLDDHDTYICNDCAARARRRYVREEQIYQEAGRFLWLGN